MALEQLVKLHRQSQSDGRPVNVDKIRWIEAEARAKVQHADSERSRAESKLYIYVKPTDAQSEQSVNVMVSLLFSYRILQ